MLFDKQFQNKAASFGNNSDSLNTLRIFFKDTVLNDSALISATNNIILSEILNARRGSEVILTHIQNILQMYYSFRDIPPQLPIFDNFFDQIISKTTIFYDDYFNSKFKTSTFSEYLKSAQKQYIHEESILRSIFHEDEIQELLQIVNSCLLLNQEDSFLSGDEPPISTALVSNDLRPLKWLVEMYKHFKASLKNVFQSCSTFVYSEMMKLAPISEKDKDSEIFERVKALIAKTESLESPYKIVFKGFKEADDELERQIKKAWNNKNAFHIVETFNNYIHQLISSEFKTFSADEREEFKHIFAKFFIRTEDRMFFSQIYEKKYVRRFIKMGAKLHEIESPYISYVQKTAKASDFAKSFETFYAKIKEASSTVDDFKNYQRSHNLSFENNDFHPLIFDSRTFPLDRVKITHLPPELNDIHSAFIAYYVENHPKAKLDLLSDISVVESKLRVPRFEKTPARTYTITTDIVCALVLLCVYKGKQKQLGDIYKEINEDKGRIGLYIKKLCQKSCQFLLRKECQDVKKLQETDVLCFNPKFSFPSLRISIPPIDPKPDQPDPWPKKSAIQAAIIRSLKKHNVVSEDTVISDVIQWTSQYFRAERKEINDQLVYLEGQDYFHRTGEDNKTYVYHQ